MDLEQLRREFTRAGLNRAQLPQDPFTLFATWLDQCVSSEIPDPTAMVLATADAQGQPEQRIVLLKFFDPEGLVFYTNYDSSKAQDIAVNSKVSLLFPWYPLDRQVRVTGLAEQVSRTQSEAYFSSRPRDSQLGAWASAQSRTVESREALERQFAEVQARFAGQTVPLPEFWGGYRVVPHRFEFWQGRPNRLHDRFEYCLQPQGQWDIHRLSP